MDSSRGPVGAARSSLDGSAETRWMLRGACRRLPPNTMFPSDGSGVHRALKICAECPTRQPCLEYAIANHITHGIWGGTSERQRRKLARELASESPH